jgi:hypothetical protein
MCGLFNISSLNCYNFKLVESFSKEARVFSLFRNVQTGSAVPEGVPWVFSPPVVNMAGLEVDRSAPSKTRRACLHGVDTDNIRFVHKMCVVE